MGALVFEHMPPRLYSTISNIKWSKMEIWQNLEQKRNIDYNFPRFKELANEFWGQKRLT